MYINLSVNEFGTVVSEHVCDTCGESFTVCPPVKDKIGWENCMGPKCVSYDPSRDADLCFGDNSGYKEAMKRKGFTAIKDKVDANYLKSREVDRD